MYSSLLSIYSVTHHVLNCNYTAFTSSSLAKIADILTETGGKNSHWKVDSKCDFTPKRRVSVWWSNTTCVGECVSSHVVGWKITIYNLGGSLCYRIYINFIFFTYVLKPNIGKHWMVMMKSVHKITPESMKRSYLIVAYTYCNVFQ